MIRKGHILYHVDRNGHIEIATVQRDEEGHRVLVEVNHGRILNRIEPTEMEVRAQDLFTTLGRAAIESLRNRKQTYYNAQKPSLDGLTVVR